MGRRDEPVDKLLEQLEEKQVDAARNGAWTCQQIAGTINRAGSGLLVPGDGAVTSPLAKGLRRTGRYVGLTLLLVVSDQLALRLSGPYGKGGTAWWLQFAATQLVLMLGSLLFMRAGLRALRSIFARRRAADS